MTAVRPLIDRYRGRCIFLTGGSGFLGLTVLEKMLRSLAEVQEIVLLMRGRGRSSPGQRVTDMMSTPLFDRLRSERPDFDAWWPTKVTWIEGSLGAANLGMQESAYESLRARLGGVVHIGAVASFEEPLDHVLEVNTRGALDVLELARAAGNAPMVHVSTAYVCGRTEGDHAEEAIPWGHTPRGLESFDPEPVVQGLLDRSRELRIAVESGRHDRAALRSVPRTLLSGERVDLMRREYADKRLARRGVRVAIRHGWPDPYPMSKALAEQLLVRRRGEVPLAIVRPAILASTVEQPVPGWLSGLRMADPIIAAMGRGVLDRFPGDPTTVLDIVPCDLAVHAILAAMPTEGDAAPRVVHVATSSSNPLPLVEHGRLWFDALVDAPFRDREGHPVAPSLARLDTPSRVRESLVRRRRNLLLRLAILERLGFDERARSVRSQLRFLRRERLLGSAYTPYTMRHFRFGTERLRELEASLSPEDRASFPMDPASLDWTHYLTAVHVPAVRREAGGDGRNGSG